MLLDERSVATDPDAPAETSDGPEPARTADRVGLLAATAAFTLALLAGFGLQVVLPTAVALGSAAVVGTVVAAPAARRLLSTTVGAGLSWWVISAVATVLILNLADTEQHQVVRTLLTAVLLIVPMLLRHLQLDVADGKSLRTALADRIRVLAEPTTGLAATMIGVGVAAPLIGTYAPVISEADSAWVVVSTNHVREDGIGLIQETQDVLLPHLTISPLLAIGGFQAAVAFVTLNLIAVAALAGYIGYRLTNRGAGALVAALVLMSMPVILDHSARLPMYTASIFFGYGAAWVLHQAMADPAKHRWWAPIAAGIGLVLAFEAHGVGQIFLATPFLLLLLHPWRQALRPLAVTLATVAVVSVPRVIINLSEGGLADFRQNYTDFFVRKYLPIVNRDLWNNGGSSSAVEYMDNLPTMTESALGSRAMFLLLLIPVAVAALHTGRRALLFVTASTGVFLAALLVSAPSPFSRYLTPLALGVALVVAVGVVAVLRQQGEARTIGRIVVSVLAVAAFLQVVDTVEATVAARESIIHGPWPDLVAAIDDDKSVIGVRSHQLTWADPDQMTDHRRTMTEEDWVTYLTWPDDEAVAEVMERYDAGWIYTMPDLTLELLYDQTWLEPTYGRDVNHITGVVNSDLFCLAAEEDGFLLFRYGECRPGDLGALPPDYVDDYFDPNDPYLIDRVTGEMELDEEGPDDSELDEEDLDGDVSDGEVDTDDETEGGVEDDADPEEEPEGGSEELDDLELEPNATGNDNSSSEESTDAATAG